MSRVLPWLLLIGVAWFGGCQYAKNREADREIHSLRHTLNVLAEKQARVDTVVVVERDTLRLTRRVTDTLLSTDTLWRVERVREIVTAERNACDATIAALDSSRSVCGQRLAVMDSLLTLERRKRGSPWKTKLGWLLAGAAAASLIPR